MAWSNNAQKLSGLLGAGYSPDQIWDAAKSAGYTLDDVKNAAAEINPDFDFNGFATNQGWQQPIAQQPVQSSPQPVTQASAPTMSADAQALSGLLGAGYSAQQIYDAAKQGGYSYDRVKTAVNEINPNFDFDSYLGANNWDLDNTDIAVAPSADRGNGKGLASAAQQQAFSNFIKNDALRFGAGKRGVLSDGSRVDVRPNGQVVLIGVDGQETPISADMDLNELARKSRGVADYFGINGLPESAVKPAGLARPTGYGEDSYLGEGGESQFYRTPEGATGRNVQRNDTVQERLNGLLSADSAYIQQARGDAQIAAARRGLSNSSLAGQGGVEAAIRQALPISQQDAQTYFTQGRANQDTENTFTQARFGRDFTAGENRLNRAFQTGERLGGEAFTAGQNNLNRAFQTGERIGAQAFTGGQNDLNRNFQSTENQSNRDFQSKESQFNRDFQSTEAEKTRKFTSEENEKQRQAQLAVSSAQTAASSAAANASLAQAGQLASAQLESSRLQLSYQKQVQFANQVQDILTSDKYLTVGARLGALRVNSSIFGVSDIDQQALEAYANFTPVTSATTTTGTTTTGTSDATVSPYIGG